jgi:hypothetical protein
MNSRQRSIRAGIREAKRTGQPFHMVEVASCAEPKVVDEAKVQARIDAEMKKTRPSARKIRRLKAKIA